MNEIKAIPLGPKGYSEFAKEFNEESDQWMNNAEMNYLFVQCQQNYANHLLTSRGNVFLNEVYDMLGLPRTQRGALVGWVLSKDPEETHVPISFGLPDSITIDKNTKAAFMLDFNVDGEIWNKI